MMFLVLLVLLAFLALAAIRGVGWLGLPLSALICLFLWLMGSEDGAMIGGVAVAALAAMTLPPRDGLAAAGLGILSAFLFESLPTGNPDNPLNYIFAICSTAFALGGLAGSMISALRRRRADQLAAD
ncbi:MAG TPA: hypothetical protein VF582_01470 [Allosphingosinicella sp.]|jgi:hypothetical protein